MDGTNLRLVEGGAAVAVEPAPDRWEYQARCELRSLLRFLYLQAIIATPLGQGVPPVPGWKDAGVPRRLALTQVQALLDSCDRARAAGKRDFAILLLLARMGLRAAEVAGLELDDFDWRAGELVVHGKAGRRDRMPFPTEVGEAVAAYLLEARPRAACSRTFLTLVAPPRAMGPTAVGQMVWRQCRIEVDATPGSSSRPRRACPPSRSDREVHDGARRAAPGARRRAQSSRPQRVALRRCLTAIRRR